MHPGRAIRLLLPIVVATLLALGTWKGEDDHFPFGPFRMFSTKQELDGEVRSLQLWGRPECADWSNLAVEDFGLRRADLEGQLGKLAVEPTVLLAELGRTYRRLHDGNFPFVALELRDRVFDLEDGRPVKDTFRVLGTWQAPDGTDACAARHGGRLHA